MTGGRTQVGQLLRDPGRSRLASTQPLRGPCRRLTPTVRGTGPGARSGLGTVGEGPPRYSKGHTSAAEAQVRTQASWSPASSRAGSQGGLRGGSGRAELRRLGGRPDTGPAPAVPEDWSPGRTAALRAWPRAGHKPRVHAQRKDSRGPSHRGALFSDHQEQTFNPGHGVDEPKVITRAKEARPPGARAVWFHPWKSLENTSQSGTRCGGGERVGHQDILVVGWLQRGVVSRNNQTVFLEHVLLTSC